MKQRNNKPPKWPCRDLYSRILESKLGEPCLAELPFCEGRRFRFDYAFPQKKVAIEIDGGVWIGGRHSGGTGQVKDFEKMNIAAELGWTVLHYTPQEKMLAKTFMQIYRVLKTRQ